MKRLTFEKDGHYWSNVLEIKVETDNKNRVTTCVGDFEIERDVYYRSYTSPEIERLAEYEATGLTPLEICDMIYHGGANLKLIHGLTLTEVVEKLKKLEELEEFIKYKEVK